MSPRCELVAERSMGDIAAGERFVFGRIESVLDHVVAAVCCCQVRQSGPWAGA